MYPELFRLGPITLHTFGFTLAVTFLTIAWLAAREFNRRGYSSDDAWSATLAAMVGGVLGAKLYFVFDNFGEALSDPRGIIFTGSGLTYYGGLMGGAIAVAWVGFRRKIPMRVFMDMAAPLIAFGYGLGRVGCFLNGDDYGKPCDLPWAMAFPKGAPPTEVAVHPTQIYEAAASLGFFVLLWMNLGRWEHRPGFTMGLYLVLAGTERFLVEFVRLNSPVLLGMTMAQIISILLFAAGIVLIARSNRR